MIQHSNAFYNSTTPELKYFFSLWTFLTQRAAFDLELLVFLLPYRGTNFTIWKDAVPMISGVSKWSPILAMTWSTMFYFGDQVRARASIVVSRRMCGLTKVTLCAALREYSGAK